MVISKLHIKKKKKIHLLFGTLETSCKEMKLKTIYFEN